MLNWSLRELDGSLLKKKDLNLTKCLKRPSLGTFKMSLVLEKAIDAVHACLFLFLFSERLWPSWSCEDDHLAKRIRSSNSAKSASGFLCDYLYSPASIVFLRLIIYVSQSLVFYEPGVKLLSFIVCDSFLKLYSYNCKLTAFPNLCFEFIASLLVAFF